MNTVDLPKKVECPYCGFSGECATEIGTNQKGGPGPGDVMVCWKCAKPGVMTEDGTIRKPNDEELEKYKSDPRYAQIPIIMAGRPKEWIPD